MTSYQVLLADIREYFRGLDTVTDMEVQSMADQFIDWCIRTQLDGDRLERFLAIERG